MKPHRAMRAMLMLALSLGAAAPPARTQETVGPPRTGTVSANILNVRARPATHYEVVGHLKQGDTVSIVGEKEDWYEISAPAETKAFVAARFIDESGLITGDNVRVHAGPGLVFTSFALAAAGTKVRRLGEPENDWQRIRVPPEATVWASSAYIRVETDADADTGPEVIDALESTAPDKEAGLPAIQAQAADSDPAPEVPAAPASEPAAGPTPEPPTSAVEDRPATAAATADAVAPDAEASAAPTAPDGPESQTPQAIATRPAAVAPEIAVPEAIPVPDIRSPAVAAERQETPGAADLLPPITVTEASAPRPEVPAGSDMSAPIQPPAQPTTTPPVIREGLVMPIPGADTAVVTHTLNLRVGYTCYPLYYLHSNRIDLREWEMHEVRVYGKEVWHPGWNRAVIEVTSIQIHRPD